GLHTSRRNSCDRPKDSEHSRTLASPVTRAAGPCRTTPGRDVPPATPAPGPSPRADTSAVLWRSRKAKGPGPGVWRHEECYGKGKFQGVMPPCCVLYPPRRRHYSSRQFATRSSFASLPTTCCDDCVQCSQE